MLPQARICPGFGARGFRMFLDAANNLRAAGTQIGHQPLG